jgi:hypothetical protein
MTLTALYIILTAPERSFTPEALFEEVAKQKNCNPEDEDQIVSLLSRLLEDLVSEHMAERVETDGEDRAYRAIRPFDRAAYLDKEV